MPTLLFDYIYLTLALLIYHFTHSSVEPYRHIQTKTQTNKRRKQTLKQLGTWFKTAHDNNIDLQRPQGKYLSWLSESQLKASEKTCVLG